MTTIWRINIKTAAAEGINPRKFCIEKKILGVGWPVDVEGEIGWEKYYKLGEETYYKAGDKGWWPAVNAIKDRMRVNDLCWTRDWDGIYYIGRIISDWQYIGTDEYREADIVNIRQCDWQTVGEVDAVPGKVVNSFIPSRTVQVVNDKTVCLYSQFLYNKLSNKDLYELGKDREPLDLFALLSAYDCEDIVGLFLQENGYRIIPSSCKADTVAYEFVLKHREKNTKAIVQVKQGNADLDVTAYTKLPEEVEVYLFRTDGNYNVSSSNHIHCLDPIEMKIFAYAHRNIMSDRLKTWIEIHEQLTDSIACNV